jgi:ribosome modulation factor
MRTDTNTAWRRGYDDALAESASFRSWDAAGRLKPRPYQLAVCPYDVPALFGAWMNGFVAGTADASAVVGRVAQGQQVAA